MSLSERVPPQSLDAETATLGAMMLDPHQAAWEVVAILNSPEQFYRTANQTVFRALLDLLNDGKPIDPLLLKNELERRGQLDAIGGASRINELMDVLPHASRAAHYAALVRDTWQLRCLIDACGASVREAYDNQEPASTVVERAESRLLAVLEKRTADDSVLAGDLMAAEIARLEKREVVRGIPTHFRDLDEMTGGLRAGELIILAARPSMGKTAMAANILRNVAVWERVPSAFFSLETPAGVLARNLLAQESGMSARAIADCAIGERDMGGLRNASAVLSAAPYEIADIVGGLSILGLRARVRVMRAKRKVGFVVVDYLQLMDGVRQKGGNREQEIASISRGLKQLARELKIPVLALAQLSRGCEQRDDKRPRMSDLRESGALEQDADMALFLFREAYYKPDKAEVARKAEVIVAKNRNGNTGTVELDFDRVCLRFSDARDGGRAA